MGRFSIKAGAHYARPFAGWPWIGKRSIERTVTFSPECAYELPAYHADNVNKLFGLSFGFGGVHGNSARFGWRWNAEAACIDLVAYVYRNGQRNQDEHLRFPVVAQVKPGQRVNCRLGLHANGFYFFTVRDANDEILGMHLTDPAPADLPGFGLTHSLYFGGSLPAPHDMSVQIDRI